MKVKVEDGGPCRKVMHVAVPAESALPEYSSVLKEYAKVAKLPGFRKGKAPRGVVEAKFSDSIGEDTRERLIPRFYRQALEENNIEPIAVIDVADAEFSKEQGLSFKVTIDIAPEFKLPKYKKISLRSEKKDVDDAQVEEAIDSVRRRFSRFEDVSDRAVQKADLAQIDYSGTCDGQPLDELASDCSGLGQATDFWALVDQPEFLPGFTEELIGMEIGQDKEITIEFPADFHVPAVAGKQGVYQAHLKGIRAPVLAELDDEFLKRFDVETPQAMRDKVREDLQGAAEENEKRRLHGEIAKRLVSKTKLDVPASVVEQEMRLLVRDIVDRSTRQGATQEQLEEQREQIMSAASDSSLERVKTSYILARIAEQEDIHVSDDEVNTRIDALSARYGMTTEQFRAELDKRNTLEQLKNDVRSEKTMDFLLEHAKIK